MAYDLAKVTANGNNLIAQILANKSSLSVDKIEISDTQLPSTTDISTMTSVPKVVQTVSANGFSKNSNTLIISTVVDNSSISADYKAWVFGIWGSDSQNGQSQLIAVITSTNSPDTIPAFSGSTPVSYTYKFNIGFSNASQIQFNMIDDSFATNDTVVHTTGDETIDGQKKFKTDPTDSAGNAYAKTVDVNQQLDKKVNVTDMRKSASDVAGIEEVNAKQDSIGYTPANDSKVIHRDPNSGNTSENVNFTGKVQKDNSDLITVTDLNNGLSTKVTDNKNGTITANSLTYDLSKTSITPLGIVNSGSFNDLPLGTVLAAPPMTDGPDKVHGFTTTTFYFSGWGSGRKAQIAITDNENLMYFRVYTGAGWNSWTLLSDDSKVVHSTDMRKPASDVAGIEEVNAKQDKIAYTPADDSKVAHLSGANNFNTIPTVNNNPLLLASSLPADLARTGQAQTFTAAQTFSIAPVINDASTDKGDNQAATMADLKSVEESAWRQLDSSLITVDIGTIPYTNCLYKIDPVNKKIYIQWMMKINYETNYGNAYLDFSSVVSKFTSKGSGHMLYEDANHRTSETSSFSISGSKISVDAEQTSDIVVSGYLEDCWFGYDTLLI
jgi:hypothetical protein|nr:MAG TPA: tail-collar fiber protein [Caudoviricetes sp.]